MNVSEALQTGQGVQLSEALSFGGLTAITGMSIVFGVLVVLMIVLYLFKLIFYKNPKKTKKLCTLVLMELLSSSFNLISKSYCG